MLKEYNDIIWGISERRDGPMKIAGVLDISDAIKNRKTYFRKKNINMLNVVSAGQEHSNIVALVDESDRGKMVPHCDGLIIDVEDIILTVTVADCLPIYFYEPKKKVIGIAHAGWKGVVDRIAVNAVEEMKKHYNIDENKLLVYIGPHIKAGNFTVSRDNLEVYKNYKEAIIDKDKKIYIDLSSIVIEQLVNFGVGRGNILVSDEDTYTSKKYFSFRRDQPEMVEAMVAYIGLK